MDRRYAWGIALSLALVAPATANAVTLAPVTAEVSNQTIDVPPTDPATLDLLPALPTGHTVSVKLALIDKVVEISPGIKYRAWTFNGVVPGPVIHARVGDTVDVTLTNKASMGHSIDFHAALAPPNVAYQTIKPGQTLHFSWVASSPGAFLYHCGTPPVLAHISNGMYGAIVVDPAEGWGSDAQEFVFVQSEFYPQRVDGSDEYEGNLQKMLSGIAQVVDFNGSAYQYMTKPISIAVGKPVRLFVVNAGPSHFSAFHVVGTLFTRALLDGNPSNALVGIQTQPIAPGGGAVVEFTVLQPGKYPFVTHAFGDADAGAIGIFDAK
jgi:nitrite reductase (NO-forming)